MSRAWHAAALALGLAAAAVPASIDGRQPASAQWIGSWYAAPAARVDSTAPPTGTSGQSLLHVKDQTLRQIAHLTLGGPRLRIVVTNVFGTTGLKIGAGSVALRDRDAAIVPGSARSLTFGGSAEALVPAGATMTSDPVDLAVPDFADLAIDLYLPGDTAAMASPITMHAASWQTGYVSPSGNHAGSVSMPVQATTRYRRGDGLESATWFFLARVEVFAPADAPAIVAIGDSITDGTASGIDTNNRWPDHLARRLAAAGTRAAVLNAGIGGNRVLADGNGPSAVSRFERDVLDQPGARYVVVLEGINDIGQARAQPQPGAAELIAAHKTMIERAHARGKRIYGATLTPFQGANYWTREGEAKRQALNAWIRTSKAYDAVLDFDAAVRDPDEPSKLLATFDPGDHLHLNAAGYKAIADTIDPALFRADRTPDR